VEAISQSGSSVIVLDLGESALHHPSLLLQIPCFLPQHLRQLLVLSLNEWGGIQAVRELRGELLNSFGGLLHLPESGLGSLHCFLGNLLDLGLHKYRQTRLLLFLLH
jgi:hypothetical protein